MTNKNKGKKLHKGLKKVLSVTLIVALILTTPGIVQIPGWIANQVDAYVYLDIGINPNHSSTYYCGEKIDVLATSHSAADWAYAGLYTNGASSSLRWFWVCATQYVDKNGANQKGSFNGQDGQWVDIRGWKGWSSSDYDWNIEQSSRLVGTGDFDIRLYYYNGSNYIQYHNIDIKIAHKYDSTFGGSAATCTSPAKCACGATSGSALGHSYTVQTTGAAAGYTRYKCSRCSAYEDRINSYYFDVNHTLDGANLGNSKDSAVGTFDVYIGGASKGNDVGDYYTQHPYNSTYEVKDIKPMTGYHNAGSASYSGKIPASNTAVTIPWKRNVYTVVYNGNGNTGGSTANSSHQYGIAKNLTANGFTRTGYTFAGWNTAANGSGTNYSNQQSVTNLSTTNGATVNLYAKWTGNNYTLTFNPNGGILPNPGGNLYMTTTNGAGHKNTANSVPVTFGSSNYRTMSGDIPTRVGYTFKGWYTAASGGTQVYNSSGVAVGGYWSSDKWNHAGNATVYAQWEPNKYQATFDPNGGTVNPTSSQITFGQPISMPTPTRPGYAFKSWNYNVGGSNYLNLGRTYMYEDKLSVHIEAYMSDWSTFATRLISCTDGGGWNIEPGGEYIQFAGYDKGVGYKVATAGTKWKDLSSGWHSFDLVFDGTKLTGYIDGVLAGTSANYTSGRIGYNTTNSLFVGAEAAGNGTTPDTGVPYFNGKIRNLVIQNSGSRITDIPNTFVSPAQNIAFTAEWDLATYKVKYNANGGTGTMNDSNHTYTVAKALTPNAYTRTGYTFDGWATEPTGTVVYADGASVSNLTTVHGDTVNLYAVWKPIAYNVKYDANGGTGTMADSIHNYDEAKTLTANTFEYTAMEFTGWNTAADGSGTSYTDEQEVINLTTTANGTVTLYAQWIPAKCKITVKTNIWLSPINFAHGNPVSIYCVTDENGNKYYKAVEFKEEDFNLLDSTSKTVVFEDLPMANYTLSEVETYRYGYEFSTAENESSINENGTISFNFKSDGKTEGKATFTNIGIRFRWFGHNAIAGASQTISE